MCHLQKLICYGCKMKLIAKCQYELQDDNSTTYVIQPCEHLKEILSKMKEKDHKSGGRFHCPNIQWPPDHNVPTRYICEPCLYLGFPEYRFNVASEKAKNSLDRDLYRRRQIMTPSNSASDAEDADEWDDKLLDPYRHFPKSFRSIPMDSMKQQILELFKENYDLPNKLRGRLAKDEITKEVDNYWIQRASEAEHRILTLYIPRCNLCKTPTMIAEKSIEDDNATWLADVECEPNTILWKWLMARTQDSPLQLEIRSGFIAKPCDVCIKKEISLRTEVGSFLEENGHVNWIIWMVFNWLMSRGTGNIPMFEHAALNVGFPNMRPPTLNDMMSLMAESWKRVTSVPWEQVGELQPPASCTLSIVMHNEPFASLKQWPEWQHDIPLIVQHTLPSLVGDVSQLLSPEDPDDDVVVRDRRQGTKRKDRGETEPTIWDQGSQLLTRIRNHPTLMMMVEHKLGFSPTDTQKTLEAVSEVLCQCNQSPPPGSFKSQHAPARVEAPSDSTKGSGSRTHRSKKTKGGDQLKNSLPASKNTVHNASDLPSVGFETFLEPDQMFQAVAMAEARFKKVFPEDRSDVARSGSGKFTAEGGSPVVRSGFLTPSVEGSPPCRVDQSTKSKSIGKQKQTKKHLQSANPVEIGADDDDVFGDRQVDGGSSDSKRAIGNVNMQYASMEIPALEDEENAFTQCDLGHTHILEAGKVTSAPGELVFLPLGGSYNSHKA